MNVTKITDFDNFTIEYKITNNCTNSEKILIYLYQHYY